MLEIRMKVSRWLLLAAAAPLAIAGCNQFGDAMTAHTDVVARAAGHELKVEDAARLLSANPDIPSDPQVVSMLADMWVDYTLLATAAGEDTTLASIDLDRFTRDAREQQLVWKLREQVIRPDTVFTDDQLRARWLTDGPGVEIRARHILLRIPSDATTAQRDSLRNHAEEIRQRAVAGEDFATLAQSYSEDPGTAQRGGDLGEFFGRGRMVAPFENAAFRLEPGEISEVVESPFGFHVIRQEERRQPELGEHRDEFRQYLVQQAEEEAETAYLDSLTTAVNVQVRPDAYAVVREIAQQPGKQLRGRQANRVIASYSGGEFTSGHFAQYIRTQQPNLQAAFATADDEQLEGVVKQLARRDVLVREANARGVTLTQEEEAEIRREARAFISQLLLRAGLTGEASPQGAPPAVVQAHVMELLEAALRGEVQLSALGPLSFALRDAFSAEVNHNSFDQVVSQLEQHRLAQEPTTPAPMEPDTQPGLGTGPSPQPEPIQNP
jgi:hypothetical protein